MLADAAMEYMNNETHRTSDTKTEKQDEPPPLGKNYNLWTVIVDFSRISIIFSINKLDINGPNRF